MGETDHKERRDAVRLFAAVVVAGIVLVFFAVTGLYFLTDGFSVWVDSTFSSGLDLKEAATIAFGVTFFTLLVFVGASGGEALLGELPFTIIGFFAFFLFFWLMIAWIF